MHSNQERPELRDAIEMRAEDFELVRMLIRHAKGQIKAIEQWLDRKEKRQSGR